MNKVSFYACSSYEDRRAIERSLRGIIEDSGGFAALFSKGKKVVIKPNLVMKKAPEAAATTHPAIVETLIEILKEHTDAITLAECPGGPGNEMALDSVYRVTGMTAVCERHGVPVVKDRASVLRVISDGYATKSLDVLKAMDEAQVLINIGKLKSHALTTFTGCAKNLYGVIPGLSKVEYHARFSDVGSFSDLILDINRVVVPTLSILDAVVGMEGNGPTGGIPKKIGGILGGTNTFAVDLLGTKLLGILPEQAPILAAAQKRGMLPEDIIFCGDDYVPYIQSEFQMADAQRFSMLRAMPNLFHGRIKRFLEPRPVISNRCIGCGECAKCCPKKAITIGYSGTKKRASIDYGLCIRCYCCQELCPKEAVDTKKNPLLRF